MRPTTTLAATQVPMAKLPNDRGGVNGDAVAHRRGGDRQHRDPGPSRRPGTSERQLGQQRAGAGDTLQGDHAENAAGHDDGTDPGRQPRRAGPAIRLLIDSGARRGSIGAGEVSWRPPRAAGRAARRRARRRTRRRTALLRFIASARPPRAMEPPRPCLRSGADRAGAGRRSTARPRSVRRAGAAGCCGPASSDPSPAPPPAR